MSTINLGRYFYKDYYKDWHFTKSSWSADDQQKEFDERNATLLDFTFEEQPIKLGKFPSLMPLTLRTTYPGLLIGSGYNHGTGKQGEFKIGFYFDYTTGLPILPGSSVKGALRSVFPGRDNLRAKEHEAKGNEKEAKTYRALAEGKTRYLSDLLNDKMKLPDIQEDDIPLIEAAIFEGIYEYEEKKPGYLPMCERDVFYDAFLSQANSGKKILGDDYITPHMNRKKDGIPNELKNPIPIQFLKILPDIQFEFHFHLLDTYHVKAKSGEQKEVARKLNAGQRHQLFELILKDIGLGAKTNVGYGQFEQEKPRDVPPAKASRTRKSTKVRTDAPEAPPKPPKKEVPAIIHIDKVRARRTTVRGKLTDNTNGQLTLQLMIEGYDKPAVVRYPSADRFPIGKIFEVTVAAIQGQGKSRTLTVNNPKPIQ